MKNLKNTIVLVTLMLASLSVIDATQKPEDNYYELADEDTDNLETTIRREEDVVVEEPVENHKEHDALAEVEAEEKNDLRIEEHGESGY